MKKFSILLLVVFMLSALLTACGPEATVAPTEVPPPPTEEPTEVPPTPEPTEVPPTPVPENRLAITGFVVNQADFSITDMRGLGPYDLEIEGTTYNGFRLADVIAYVVPQPEAGNVVFTAEDGSTNEIAMSDLQACADCFLVLTNDGEFELAMPGFESSYWMKQLRQIDLLEDPYALLDAAYTEFLSNMVKYNTIGIEAVNEMLVENPPYLLDVRKVSEVEEKGYIPGSVLIPLNEVGENLAYLPEQDTTIVSYCGSGWRCTIAMTALGALGWDVKGLKGGSYGGWIEAGYAIEEGVPAAPEAMNTIELDEKLAGFIMDTFANVPEGFGVLTAENLNAALAENPDLVVMDVRTAPELDEKGTIPADNWMHIALQDFIANKSMWPADKDTPIAIYCGSGHRSTMAMTILWSYGYTDVTSLKGGFGGWAAEGYPVEMGIYQKLDAVYSDFLATMEAYNTIGLDALNTMLVDSSPYILDVRSVEEVENSGHIPGAVVAPLRELGDNLAYLPEQDEQVISYCGSGWRCTIALTGLEALGWDTLCLKGGSFGGWVEAGYATEEGLPEPAETMNMVELDTDLEVTISEMFASIPEGWGGITAEQLNADLADNPDIILIDARTEPELIEKGIIEAENWQFIALQDFIAERGNWPAKDAEIVVYCGSGHRSTIAMTMLWSYGYTNVSSLKGGFGGWATAEYPVGEYVAP